MCRKVMSRLSDVATHSAYRLDPCWSRSTMPWVSAYLITFASTGSAAEAVAADIFAEAVRTACQQAR